MIILSDMDGVVANFVDSILTLYNEEYGENVQYNDITHNDMHLFCRRGRAIYKYFHQEGLFRGLEVAEGSQKVINGWLDAGHEVYFVTKPVDHSLYCMKEKQAWVDEHFPRIGHKNVIFTGHKYLVRGDALIEDLPTNLENFRGYGILMAQPWNTKVNPRWASRHDSWEDIDHTVKHLAEINRS